LGAKKKKPEAPKPPVTFPTVAPSMLPTWLPWALGIVGTGLVIFLIIKKRKATQEKQA
jgi:hypothetical protein